MPSRILWEKHKRTCTAPWFPKAHFLKEDNNLALVDPHVIDIPQLKNLPARR